MPHLMSSASAPDITVDHIAASCLDEPIEMRQKAAKA
jgi:hypothetical protein